MQADERMANPLNAKCKLPFSKILQIASFYMYVISISCHCPFILMTIAFFSSVFLSLSVVSIALSYARS